jgi:hypothetical protein
MNPERSGSFWMLALALTLGATPSWAVTATDVDFDDSGTNLTGTDVQAAIEAIDTSVLGPLATFRDLEFAEPLLNAPAHGMQHPVTMPMATEFFMGAMATDEGGSLAQPNSVYCVAFNHDNCADARLNPAQHALKWKWEATRQEGALDDEYVVNRVDFTSSDGQSWSPWVFSINVDELTAGFVFSPGPGERSFTLFESGEVRVGPEDPSPPTHQLEVIGNTRIHDDLVVAGDLSVGGAVSVAGASNALMWGDASDPAFDTGAEICAASGQSCVDANRPDGTVLGCSTPAASGIVYALCD